MSMSVGKIRSSPTDMDPTQDVIVRTIETFLHCAVTEGKRRYSHAADDYAHNHVNIIIQAGGSQNYKHKQS